MSSNVIHLPRPLLQSSGGLGFFVRVVDLPRKSGEFLMRRRGSHDTATTVHEGI